ncbi:hypothetical protein IGV50_004420 [Salmonella enterica subsp. enterica serovar Newport]|nr:hypothetical protein [Salmonella enterica subsp. enterica serovar Newport]
MEYLKVFKQAGEPTIAAPIYLCEKARDQLANWQRLPVEQMQAEIVNDIEACDRFEFLAIDEGQIKAMMIITPEYNAHWGNFLMTRYTYSPDKQTVTPGYRWMIKIAKRLNLDGVLFSRQIEPNKIINQFKGLRNDQ